MVASYRVVRATGIFDTTWGRALFEKAYRLYKTHYEAGSVHALRACVRPATVVVDVGAHTGFFTLQFASWVSGGGRVIALEPEPVNCGHLRRAVARSGLEAVVEIVQAAAAETTGEARLELSSFHPADHRLGTEGVRVAITTIDDLLAARGWPEVSLIKIDVQGAEGRVLAGARQTLARFRPALYLEMNDEQLVQYGSSARELLAEHTDRGYTVHSLGKHGTSAPLTVAQALAESTAPHYFDALLLPAAAAPGLTGS